jgi:hypothetical protein
VKEIGELVSKVYAAGARLVVLDGKLAVDGEIPDALKKRVRAHRGELLEALLGDPLEGPGWEARTALYRSALQWLDKEIGKIGLDSELKKQAAVDDLCHQKAEDQLNVAWCDGDFEGFRAALRKYVRAGLHAAKSKDRG